MIRHASYVTHAKSRSDHTPELPLTSIMHTSCAQLGMTVNLKSSTAQHNIDETPSEKKLLAMVEHEMIKIARDVKSRIKSKFLGWMSMDRSF